MPSRDTDMAVCDIYDLLTLVPRGACVLGLDYGSTVVGVAVSDPSLMIASPLTSIKRTKFTNDALALGKLITERRAGALIVGLPKNMDGSEGATAQSARAFVRNLLERGNMPIADMPVAFWDERLSTAAVERFLIGEDMSRRRRDEIIDKSAAAYILQGALDALRNRARQQQ